MRDAPVERPHPLDYRFTWVLIVASAVLTVRWHTGHDLDALLVRSDLVPHEPWRLLTACLLHANVLHLLFNLLWTWRLGQVLEPIVGLLPMAAICAVLGAGSMAAEWVFFHGGVGLSGVVYGLWGMLWAMDRFAPAYRGVMDARTSQLFVVWFFLCIGFTVTGWMPIANVAHGVGAVLGALFGLALSPFPRKRLVGAAGSVALLLVVAALSVFGRPYVNLTSERAVELFIEGLEALEAGENERARELYADFVELRPEDPGGWQNLGVALYELGRRQESDEALAKARALRDEAAADGERGAPSLR